MIPSVILQLRILQKQYVTKHPMDGNMQAWDKSYPYERDYNITTKFTVGMTILKD